MANHFNLQHQQKQSLQLSLKLWLPLLQAPLQDLEGIYKEHSYDNPFLKCRSSFESSASSNSGDYDKRHFIENVNISKESLYEKLESQINAPLFPTPHSQKVAREIIGDINQDGYFEGDIEQLAIKCKVTSEFVEMIRKRFGQLLPSGVGAVSLEESLLFQVYQLDIDSKLLLLVEKMIASLKNIDKYHKHHLFLQARHIIKNLHSPPAVAFSQEKPQIIPDFFVEVNDDINIKINNNYYPDVTVSDPFTNKSSEMKSKLKEARDLVNLLDLRKSTLYKLVLLIVEKQLSFFVGSELKPLTMAIIADELGFQESTISRAVANKYIHCSRGILPLKSFFTNEVSKGLSSSEIKSFIVKLIENEPHDIPLNDQNIVDIVMDRFHIKMVRRTITKYRKLLNLPSSKERKKFYKMNN